MAIIKRLFGKMPDGAEADIFTLKNSNGVAAEITNYGCRIVSIIVPDRNGNFDDIVAGCDTLEGFLEETAYFGAVCGRVANRIEKGRFELNGIEYQLAVNDRGNHLHGGLKGFDKMLWNAEVAKQGEDESLVLSYLSKDGEENYPGNLDVKVIYTLTEDNALKIEYLAVSDKDTIINLTNHAYFNLGGHASGTIKDHILMINADRFTPIDENCIPTGELRSVKGTPMDFTKPVPIGPGLESDEQQIIYGKGYDHNWALNVSGKAPEKAAELYDPRTGRVMEVFTTKPGMQLYTGNFLGAPAAYKGGVNYVKNAALCLETQYFPAGINRPNFPSPILRAGEKYNHITIYKFSVK